MPREEKGSPMGSYDNSGSGADSGGSSLAARRARLRGSLARSSEPADNNLAPEPTKAAGADQNSTVQSAESAPAIAAPVQQLEDSDSQFDPTTVTGGGGAIASALAGAMSPKPGSKAAKSAAKAAVAASASALAPPLNASAAAEPPVESPVESNGEPQPDTSSKSKMYSPPLAAADPPSKSAGQPEINWGPAPEADVSSFPATPVEPANAAKASATSEVQPPMSAKASSAKDVVSPPVSPPAAGTAPAAARAAEPFDLSKLEPLPPIPENAVGLLTGIDSALHACATNLSALQRLSVEQTDVLKGLTKTLQNQTLFEIGLNLNSLTESLTAALEPMKAIGELVPAMDQLVSTLEGREAETTSDKLSPDQLVTSLADQLSAGLIDPWTFKCAYMAIYPSEHPADLLHRLVELLGTQRLSGDLFRAAYEAVQAAERPLTRFKSSASSVGESGGLGDGEIRQQIEELQRANEELAARQEERERELGVKLHQKEQELQEAQEMLNSRYDEFNSRYEEVAEALNKREDEYKVLIESKDMELVEKESELNLLRAQMEELANQTEVMVKDLQKQMTDVKSASNEQKPNSGFFDSAPQPASNLFQGGGAKQLFDQAPQAVQQQQTNSQSMPTQQQQQTTQQHNMPVQPPLPQPTVPQAPMAAGAPPTGVQNTSGRPAPQPAPTTPFTPGAGSYGSGVRAQVFEVIVRQALAGAPWREICAGPMQVNNISPEEVEAEVRRRQALLKQ